MRRTKKEPSSTLCGDDAALQVVCGWLGVNPSLHRPGEQDYAMEQQVRPERGGLGSEQLSRKAIRKQTGGVNDMGGLERKLMPRSITGAALPAPKQSPPPPKDSDSEDDAAGKRHPSAIVDLRSELEKHAAVQRAKARKRKKSTGGKSPTGSPAMAAGSPRKQPKKVAAAPAAVSADLPGADD
ncbi:hypothetical protein DIPPA_20709 [Diplonema papillatum]|nr:hypothetical protein DIPPA_20709 [Diplonema papillatum]